jgi:hypothetical protein
VCAGKPQEGDRPPYQHIPRHFHWRGRHLNSSAPQEFCAILPQREPSTILLDVLLSSHVVIFLARLACGLMGVFNASRQRVKALRQDLTSATFYQRGIAVLNNSFRAALTATTAITKLDSLLIAFAGSVWGCTWHFVL